jgi:hypothetical protein
MIWKYALAWIPMILIAIANGAAREAWFAKHMGELAAHQISSVSGILVLGVYIWVIVRVWRPESSGYALGVGLMWLAFTVTFEFLFGRYVRRLPWSRLLHDYDLLAGRLWLLVLAWVTVAPWVFLRVQQL